MPETRPEIRAAREPLTPTEFKRALEQGSGRAILCLQKHDPAPYKEIVLEACLQDTRFNAQCEGSRVPYLLEAMELIGDVAFFEQRILGAFPETPTITPEFHEDAWLGRQFTDFALTFAQRGSHVTHALLRERFAANPEYDEKFSLEKDDAIIELDGLAGLQFVLEQYAFVSESNPDFHINSWFDDNLEEILSVEVVQNHLKQSCLENDGIRVLVERSKLLKTQEPLQKAVKREPPSVSYSDLIERLERRNPYAGGVGVWGRFATSALIEQAARDLLDQTDSELIRGYLHVFRSRPVPLDVSHLLTFARHAKVDVRNAALYALRFFRHPAVRALALELRHQPETAIEAIGMLESNYEIGDSSIIMQAIEKQIDNSDTVTIHMFSSRIRDIYRKNRVPEALEPLTALYEVNPCSHCREVIIKLMHEIGILPDWMPEEAAWDSYEDTRTNARAWMTAA